MAGHTVCVRALCFAGGRQREVMHEQTHVYTAVCVCVCVCVTFKKAGSCPHNSSHFVICMLTSVFCWHPLLSRTHSLLLSSSCLVLLPLSPPLPPPHLPTFRHRQRSWEMLWAFVTLQGVNAFLLDFEYKRTGINNDVDALVKFCKSHGVL